MDKYTLHVRKIRTRVAHIKLGFRTKVASVGGYKLDFFAIKI